MAVTGVDYGNQDQSRWAGPFPDGDPVVPDDNADLSQPGILYVGVKGDLRVQLVSGKIISYQGVEGWLPLIVKKVFATGQAGAIADGIVVHY